MCIHPYNICIYTIMYRIYIGQNLIIGAIAGSLFSNIPTEGVSTMQGFLFFTCLYGGLTGFAM